MKKFLKKYRTGIVAGIILTVFTVYVLLDSFVIPHKYKTVYEQYSENTQPSTQVSTQSITSDSIITGDNYDYIDDNIKIKMEEYRENDTTIYVADVEISDVEYLKTAFAQDTYGRNVTATTSSIAGDHNAILAINGDFYGAQIKGYVIRNSVLYRSEVKSGNEDMAVMEDGTFKIFNESDISAQKILDEGAAQVLAFGPALLENGEIAVTSDEEVGKAMESNPRTAIGMIEPLHYVFVVSDGRTGTSEGLSLHQLAEFMQKLGVDTAYNLDGGGSSTMVFDGKVINNPTTNGRTIKERSVSDIVYIGY
ncbi:MAG: phosphodiester glycosidase family protein [Lachnospiraceae bacterium]